MIKIKYYFTLCFLAILLFSCDNDGGESVLNLKEGAVPNFTLNTDYPTILNLNKLNTGENIDFGFSFDIAQGNVKSADIIAFYDTASGETYGPATLVSDITDFPSDYVFSTEDLINAFSELNSLDDFSLGDQLRISAKLYLENGTEISLMDQDGRLYGSDIHSSVIFNAAAYYSVGCPLNGKFTGEYKLTATGSGDFGAFTNSGTVTLEETSQTERTVAITYLPEIGGFDEDLILSFVCDNLSVPKVDTGLACASGSAALSFGSTDGGITIDPEDDSSFTLNIVDFQDDGGCGVSSYDVTLQFEKL